MGNSRKKEKHHGLVKSGIMQKINDVESPLKNVS
jgi:hypothetical protein